MAEMKPLAEGELPLPKPYLSYELPHRYSMTKFYEHAPFLLCLNGRICTEQGRLGNEWNALMGEEGVSGHIKAFCALMNRPEVAAPAEPEKPNGDTVTQEEGEFLLAADFSVKPTRTAVEVGRHILNCAYADSSGNAVLLDAAPGNIKMIAAIVQTALDEAAQPAREMWHVNLKLRIQIAEQEVADWQDRCEKPSSSEFDIIELQKSQSKLRKLTMEFEELNSSNMDQAIKRGFDNQQIRNVYEIASHSLCCPETWDKFCDALNELCHIRKISNEFMGSNAQTPKWALATDTAANDTKKEETR